MKICLINNLYRPYAKGGAGRIVETIANDLKLKGYQVFVVSTASSDRQRGKEEKGVYYLDSVFYNLEKIPIFLRLFWHIWDSFNFINFIKIKKILKEERPDVAMTHNLKGVGFLTPALLRGLKIKHVHTLHDIQLLHPSGLMIYKKEGIINTPWAKIYQVFNKFLFGSPDLVVSPSSWLLDLHKKKGFFKLSKSAVLKNPVSFSSGTKEGKENNRKFSFLYVGQIEKHKGVLFLIKVFIELLKKISPDAIELLIAGYGSELGRAETLAKAHSQIRILGKKTREEVKGLMGNADCLVVPSACYENSPTVIYEAIKTGLPIVASSIGGIPELIEKAGGFLFEPENFDDLAAKMRLVINNREELEKVRKKEKEFKPKDYVEELMSLLVQEEGNVIK